MKKDLTLYAPTVAANLRRAGYAVHQGEISALRVRTGYKSVQITVDYPEHLFPAVRADLLHHLQGLGYEATVAESDPQTVIVR